MRAQEITLESQTVKLLPQLYVPHPSKLQENSLKPQAKLWTSTAIKTTQGYTSAWVNWAQSEMPGWVGSQGYLFDVTSGAKILTINSDRVAIRVARQYGINIQDPVELFQKMPWSQIAQHYDAVHHVPAGRDVFMGSWDVESTAWFNLGVLQSQGEVALANKRKNKIQK
jgi:hypothetical protein